MKFQLVQFYFPFVQHTKLDRHFRFNQADSCVGVPDSQILGFENLNYAANMPLIALIYLEACVSF